MLESIAERRIGEAVANGELDNLPGAGKPLELDDDPLVPEELRLAYRILKNAGYVPPEIEELKSTGVRKLLLLEKRIGSRYYSKVIRKLGR